MIFFVCLFTHFNHFKMFDGI